MVGVLLSGMNIESFALPLALPRTVIDIHTDQQRIFCLTPGQLLIYHLAHLDLLSTITLAKPNIQPTTLYVDNSSIFIGYVDGTVEIRMKTAEYPLHRITSRDDASGPGSSVIGGISASASYVLVRADENGLLIYSKPTLLFYKWIMIGGHTIIRSVAIRDHLLYVLTADHEIHLLDFSIHRIYEQQVMSYRYIDIEFDGRFLYAATSTAVLIYLPPADSREVKPELIHQLNFTETIQGLAIVANQLLVVFDQEIQVVQLPDLSSPPDFSLSQEIAIPTSDLLPAIKYQYSLTYDLDESDQFIVWYNMASSSYMLSRIEM